MAPCVAMSVQTPASQRRDFDWPPALFSESIVAGLINPWRPGLSLTGRLLARQRRAARARPSESYLRKNALNHQPTPLSLDPRIGVNARGTVVLAIVAARLRVLTGHHCN
jgi:hypothetical protein